jgi:RNAse (barnase) inhibitor barstar
VHVISLDARKWKTASDFYDALLGKLGAPDWHGRNIAALVDSMIVGDINQVESPLRVDITGINQASDQARDAMLSVFVALTRYGAVARITRSEASLEIGDGVSPYW